MAWWSLYGRPVGQNYPYDTLLVWGLGQLEAVLFSQVNNH